jgi:hypothetical protein
MGLVYGLEANIEGADLTQIESVPVFNCDGRLRGSYVYLLICQVGPEIRIKIGQSASPLARLASIRTGCAVIPDTIAIAELHSKRIALQLERRLHEIMDEWRTHGEWFSFAEADRAEFNARLRPIVASYSTASRPIRWRKYSVDKLIKDGHARRRYMRHLWAKGSKEKRLY